MFTGCWLGAREGHGNAKVPSRTGTLSSYLGLDDYSDAVGTTSLPYNRLLAPSEPLNLSHTQIILSQHG